MEEGIRATKKNNNNDPNFLSKTNESGQENPEKLDLSNDSQKAVNQTIRTRAPTPRTRKKRSNTTKFLYRFVIRSFQGLGKGQNLGGDGSGGENGWEDLGRQRGGFIMRSTKHLTNSGTASAMWHALGRFAP